MAMIPYEELVAGLHQWRMRQGLAVGSSDYLGDHQGYQIGEQIVPHPDMSQQPAYDGAVGDSTSEVDAGDLEVLSEEEAGFSDAEFPATESMQAVADDDYGEQAYDYGADQPAPSYDDQEQSYEVDDFQVESEDAAPAEAASDQPQAYDDQQPYDDQAYEAQGFDDQAYEAQSFDDQAYEAQSFDDQAQAQDDQQQPYDDQAYEAQSFDDQAYDQPPQEPDAAAGEAPAYDDAALYAEAEAPAESPFDVGDDDATMIGEAPGPDQPGEQAMAYDAELPPPPAADDGTMDVDAGEILSEEDEETRIGGDPAGGAEPPPLAPPPDDDPNAA